MTIGPPAVTPVENSGTLRGCLHVERNSIAMRRLFEQGPAIVFDLEWTSWAGFKESGWRMRGKAREVIQIGAVRVEQHDGDFRQTGEFGCLIRPSRHPVLSGYFQDLTGITQAQVEAEGLAFEDAFRAFMTFVGGDGALPCCWGWDHIVLKENCRHHGITVPKALERAVNLVPYLGDVMGFGHKVPESSRLAAEVGLDQVGQAHDALDDARSIAAAIQHLGHQGRI